MPRKLISISRRKIFDALLIFGLTVVLLQYINTSIFDHTFDPVEIFNYASGFLLEIFFDVIIIDNFES